MEFSIKIKAYSTAPNSGLKISSEIDLNIPTKNLTLENKKVEGRISQTVSGYFEIHGENFDDLFKWQLEAGTGGIYYNIRNFDYNIYLDGKEIADETIGIELVNIDRVCKYAKLQFNEISFGIYNSIYQGWDEKTNIIAGGVSASSKVRYKQNRTITQHTVTGRKTFDAIKVGSGDRVTTGQFDYVQGYTLSNYTLIKVDFAYYDHSCTSNTVTLDITYTFERLEADGSNLDSYYQKPSGINWGGGSGGYEKGIKRYDYTTGDLVEASDCGLDRDMFFYESFEWQRETVNDIVYDNGILLEDLLSYYMPGITFDSSSFSGLTEHDTIVIMGLSNTIPDYLGNAPEYSQSVMNMSLKGLLDWFVSRGFTWYIEEISSVYYFRMIYTKDISFNTNNPNLKTYLGQKWDIQTTWQNKQEPFYILENATNSTGGYFSLSKDFGFSYNFQKKTLNDNNFLTDIDYIIDAKEDNFDRSNVDDFVVLNTNWNGTEYEIIRQSTPTVANNINMSLYYLIQNMFCNLPITYSSSTDKKRLYKNKELELKLPIKDIFNDFDLNSYINYRGLETEIDSIKQEKGDSFAKVIIRTLWYE